jgi:hypothetical protein
MPVSGHNPPPTHGLTHPRAFSGDGHQNLAQLEAIHMSIILGDGTCMELKKNTLKASNGSVIFSHISYVFLQYML